MYGAGLTGPDGEPAWWSGDSPWGQLWYSWNRTTSSGLVWGPEVSTATIRYRPGISRASGFRGGFDDVPREGLILTLDDREGEVQQPGTRGLLTGFLRSLTRDGRGLTAQVGPRRWHLRARGAAAIAVTRDDDLVARAGTGLKARFELETDCKSGDLVVAVLLSHTVGHSLFPSNYIG